MARTYTVLVNDAPAIYPRNFFPRKYRYKKEAIAAAQAAVDAGASFARVENDRDGVELDFRPHKKPVTSNHRDADTFDGKGIAKLP